MITGNHGLSDRMTKMKKARSAPCANCRGRVKAGNVAVDLRRGRTLVVINHVPAYVCDRCGYQEFTPDVVDKLQKAFRRRAKARRKLKVPVVEFEAVA